MKRFRLRHLAREPQPGENGVLATTVKTGRSLIPTVYRRLLSDAPTRRLLLGLGVSALGDGMSTVSIAWLAMLLAPSGHIGEFVGIAVAAYALPGAAGALVPGHFLHHWPVRALVLAHTWLRAGLLATIAILWVTSNLTPYVYVALLAGSSIMDAWGNAGNYTMLSDLGGPEGQLGANSLYNAQIALAVIVGPLLAGLLVAPLGIGSLISLDAASFAFLGIQAWRTQVSTPTANEPINAQAAEAGFRLLRKLHMMSLIIPSWLFFFLYGPVEVALPIYVAHDLHASAGLLGIYWTFFGIGALVAALMTGMLRNRNIRWITLLIVAGWGACLLPFIFAPVGVTLACFALGGLIYGPFIPLTYALFQSSTANAHLPTVLAARSAIIMVATPLGTVAGGPLVATLGAAQALTASGVATVLLAVLTGLIWTRKRRPKALAQVWG